MSLTAACSQPHCSCFAGSGRQASVSQQPAGEPQQRKVRTLKEASRAWPCHTSGLHSRLAL